MTNIKSMLIMLCCKQNTVTHLNEKGSCFENETKIAILGRDRLIDEIVERVEKSSMNVSMSAHTVEQGAVVTGVKIGRLG